jgi:LysR family transcriptional regulator, transcriptional activator of the cysJI operon
VFLEVAGNLSFSKAAGILFISQPAVSKHVKSLESFYQCALVDRTNQRIGLTQTGEILFKQFKRRFRDSAKNSI